ncbi:MAG: helix-hairpin-helix domain-containing protein, partial [Candidatus Kapaibacteriota bacterium]
HRFAISYHRKLREKRTITTELLNIKGVGEKVAKKLLNAFGSVAEISLKSPEELKAVVGEKLAMKIYKYFQSNQM